MKLSKYAKELGVDYRTAWNWFKSGEIEGAYQTPTGRLINADLNGALSILRKEIPNAFSGYGIEVCSTPIVLTIK